MGKLFGGRNKYRDEEYENEGFDGEADEELVEEPDEEADEESAIGQDGEASWEDDSAQQAIEESDIEEADEEEGGAEEADEDGDCAEETDEEEDGADEVDENEADEEEDDAEEADEEEVDEDEDDEEEEPEDERRAFRRRRRIRNQLICYSVVLVFLAALAGCGIVVGGRIMRNVKARQQAEEQARLEAEAQAAQEAEEAGEIVIDAPESYDTEETETTEEDYLGDMVDACISEMPLQDKVAGLFIITPEALTGVGTAVQAGEGTQTALNECAIGGLIYFDKNIVDEEQLKQMLAGTSSMSRYPIFLAVDEEGGTVSRVANSSIDVADVGAMADIGASGDTAQAHQAGADIGAYLSGLGFNLDFAPVADVTAEGIDTLGSRTFGTDPQIVGSMVAETVSGIEEQKVSACLKHFPGLGSAEGDTHEGRAEITKTLDEMRASDFVPFQQGIEAGADFVMVSHAVAVSLDEEAVPSSLSKKVITDILRGELGFQGVVVTDALNMGSITEYYTADQAAVMALQAGADMLLMPEDFQTAYEGVLKAVEDGTITEERLNESLERIYRVKYAGKLDEADMNYR